jgi:uncharacterized protein (TIGR00303 family)
MRSPILFAAAREGGQALVGRWRGQSPTFWCVLAHTDTCLLPGVSAAGISEELRPLTPAADAEVVHLGSPRCLPSLPSNPLGAPGPSGITRAALHLANVEPCFLGLGLRAWPQTPYRRIAGEPGGRIDHGNAVRDARELFERGLEIGSELRTETGYLVLAESVPGGTTTALALLLALGFDAEGRVSGSMPGNSHALKNRVVHAALEAGELNPGDGRADPLGAVAQIGDPMQPLATGIALSARRLGIDVMLAGGSQMLAVAALIAALEGTDALERMAIGTTRWVIDDPAADVRGLAADVYARLPVLAINLDFSRSRHPGLRGYEQFMVKEGVGAGGACIASVLATGADIETLETCIETTYDDVLA